MPGSVFTTTMNTDIKCKNRDQKPLHQVRSHTYLMLRSFLNTKSDHRMMQQHLHIDPTTEKAVDNELKGGSRNDR